MRPTRPPTTSAWMHRWDGRCWARNLTRSCRWRCLRAAPPSRSSPWSTRRLPDDPHVLELPRITLVDVLREQSFAIGQRGPVGIGADHFAPVGLTDLDIAAEVDLIRFDQA